jgi:diguanylate cyclase (GGDEF)-like protein
MFLTGVLQSFGIVLLASTAFIVLRLASTLYEINPILYTVIAFMTTSISLSLLAGPGKYAVSSLKSKDSWFYALFLVGLYISQVFLVKYVSGTEAAIFTNLAIPISIIYAWLFLKRIPTKIDLLGVFIVCFVLYMAFEIQPDNIYLTVVTLSFLVGLFSTLMTVSSETHSQSQKANVDGYFRDKLRVVAFVSFIAAIMFLIIALSVSFIKTYYVSASIKEFLAFIPDINNFINLPTVLLGIFMGIFIVPLNRYFRWSASYKIKSENVLCIISITPLLTLFAEWLLSFTPFIDANNYVFADGRGLDLLLIVILSIIGAGIPVFRKVYKNYKDLKAEGISFKQQLKESKSFDSTGLDIRLADDNSQDYEVILAAVNHCQKDFKKAAAMLEIPITTLKVIYEGLGTYVLNEATSNLINKNFREKVVLSDSLTGLANRTALISALEKLYNNKTEFGLVFIDLNKFKHINDTYGHEAGDLALVDFANRLKTFYNSSCFVARFAGDEFCILLPFAKNKTAEVLKQLKAHTAGIFKFNNEELDLTASFGLANSIDYKNPQDLLNSADSVMFKNKLKAN